MKKLGEDHMKSCSKIKSEMPRLFVVFGTYDRIWSSSLYSRELSPMDMDTSPNGVQFIFQTDHFAGTPTGQTTTEKTELLSSGSSLHEYDNSFYLQSHREHAPVVFGHQQIMFLPNNLNHRSHCCHPIIFGNLHLKDDFRSRDCCDSVNENVKSDSKDDVNVTSYFVLPVKRCTVVVDAHVASCMSLEYHRSRTFRRRFFHKIRKSSGFKDCRLDYEKWTQGEQEAWDNYLSIPFMINVVALWPWQKVDYAWSHRILDLFNKHVTLEESLAWLSTLGGAHSSLGETFIDHAERAGEISIQQLKLARELGNEIMIARCFLYWAWSLLQRDYLTKCKICILNTWKYVQKIKCHDKILTNMCRAVWNRLQYQRSLVAKTKVTCSPGRSDSGYRDPDGSACGAQRPGSVKRSRIQMQPVEVF